MAGLCVVCAKEADGKPLYKKLGSGELKVDVLTALHSMHMACDVSDPTSHYICWDCDETIADEYSSWHNEREQEVRVAQKQREKDEATNRKMQKKLKAAFKAVKTTQQIEQEQQREEQRYFASHCLLCHCGFDSSRGFSRFNLLKNVDDKCTVAQMLMLLNPSDPVAPELLSKRYICCGCYNSTRRSYRAYQKGLTSVPAFGATQPLVRSQRKKGFSRGSKKISTAEEHAAEIARLLPPSLAATYRIVGQTSPLSDLDPSPSILHEAPPRFDELPSAPLSDPDNSNNSLGLSLSSDSSDEEGGERANKANNSVRSGSTKVFKPNVNKKSHSRHISSKNASVAAPIHRSVSPIVQDLIAGGDGVVLTTNSSANPFQYLTSSLQASSKNNVVNSVNLQEAYSRIQRNLDEKISSQNNHANSESNWSTPNKGIRTFLPDSTTHQAEANSESSCSVSENERSSSSSSSSSSDSNSGSSDSSSTDSSSDSSVGNKSCETDAEDDGDGMTIGMKIALSKKKKIKSKSSKLSKQSLGKSVNSSTLPALAPCITEQQPGSSATDGHCNVCGMKHTNRPDGWWQRLTSPVPTLPDVSIKVALQSLDTTLADLPPQQRKQQLVCRPCFNRVTAGFKSQILKKVADSRGISITDIDVSKFKVRVMEDDTNKDSENKKAAKHDGKSTTMKKHRKTDDLSKPQKGVEESIQEAGTNIKRYSSGDKKVVTPGCSRSENHLEDEQAANIFEEQHSSKLIATATRGNCSKRGKGKKTLNYLNRPNPEPPLLCLPSSKDNSQRQQEHPSNKSINRSYDTPGLSVPSSLYSRNSGSYSSLKSHSNSSRGHRSGTHKWKVRDSGDEDYVPSNNRKISKVLQKMQAISKHPKSLTTHPGTQAFVGGGFPLLEQIMEIRRPDQYYKQKHGVDKNLKVSMFDLQPRLCPEGLLGRRVSAKQPSVLASACCGMCSRLPSVTAPGAARSSSQALAEQCCKSDPKHSTKYSSSATDTNPSQPELCSEEENVEPPNLNVSFKWARLSLGIATNIGSGLLCAECCKHVRTKFCSFIQEKVAESQGVHAPEVDLTGYNVSFNLQTMNIVADPIEDDDDDDQEDNGGEKKLNDRETNCEGNMAEQVDGVSTTEKKSNSCETSNGIKASHKTNATDPVDETNISERSCASSKENAPNIQRYKDAATEILVQTDVTFSLTRASQYEETEESSVSSEPVTAPSSTEQNCKRIADETAHEKTSSGDVVNLGSLHKSDSKKRLDKTVSKDTALGFSATAQQRPDQIGYKRKSNETDLNSSSKRLRGDTPSEEPAPTSPKIAASPSSSPLKALISSAPPIRSKELTIKSPSSNKSAIGVSDQTDKQLSKWIEKSLDYDIQVPTGVSSNDEEDDRASDLSRTLSENNHCEKEKRHLEEDPNEDATSDEACEDASGLINNKDLGLALASLFFIRQQISTDFLLFPKEMVSKHKFSASETLDINIPCKGSTKTIEENTQCSSNKEYDAPVSSHVSDAAAAPAVDRINSKELEEEEDQSIELVQRIGKDQLTIGLLLMIEEYRDHIGAHHETFVTWVKRLSGRIPDSEALRHLLDTFATSKIAKASVMFKKVPENIWLDAETDSESDVEIEPQAEENGDRYENLIKGGLVNENAEITEEDSLVLNLFSRGDVKFCSVDVEQPYSWTNYLDGINIDDLVLHKPHPTVKFDNFSNGLLYALWRTCVTLNFSNNELDRWLIQLSPVSLKKAVLSQLLSAAEAMHRHILAAPQHLGQLGVPILYYGKSKGKALSDAAADKSTAVGQQKNSYKEKRNQEQSTTTVVDATDSSIIAGRDQHQKNNVNQVEMSCVNESDTPSFDCEAATFTVDDDIIVEKVVKNNQAGGAGCLKLLPLAHVGRGLQCVRPSHAPNRKTKISATPSVEPMKTSQQNCDLTCVTAASSTHRIGNNNQSILSRTHNKYAIQYLRKEGPKVPAAGNSSALTLGASVYDGTCQTFGSIKCRQSVNHAAPVTLNSPRTNNTCFVGTKSVSPNSHVQHRVQPNTSASVDTLTLSERYQRPMPASKKRTLRSTSMQPQRVVFCGQDDGQSASFAVADGGRTEGASVSPKPLSLLRPTARPAHLSTSVCNKVVQSSLVVVPHNAQKDGKIFHSFVSLKKMKLDSNDVGTVCRVDGTLKKSSENASEAVVSFSPSSLTSVIFNNSSVVTSRNIPEKITTLPKSHLRPAGLNKLLESSSHSISCPIQIDLRSDDEDETICGKVSDVIRDRVNKYVVSSSIAETSPGPLTSDLLAKRRFVIVPNKRASDLPYFEKTARVPCVLDDSLGNTGKNHGVDLDKVVMLNSGFGTRPLSPNKCKANEITTDNGNHSTASRVTPPSCIRLSPGLSSAFALSADTNPDLQIPVHSDATKIASTATCFAPVVSQAPRIVTTVLPTDRPISTPRITTRKDLMPTRDPIPVPHPTSNLDPNITPNETTMRPFYRQVNKVPPLNPLMSSIFPNGTVSSDAVPSSHAIGPTPIIPCPAGPVSMQQCQQLQQGRAVLISGNCVASSSLSHFGSQGSRVTGAAIAASAPHLPLVTSSSVNGLQPIGTSNDFSNKKTFSSSSAENNAAEASMLPPQQASKISSSFCVNSMEQNPLQGSGALTNVANPPTIIHNGKPYRAYLLTPSTLREDSTVDLLGPQQQQQQQHQLENTSPELCINPALRQAFLEAKNSDSIILNPCDQSISQQSHSSSGQNVFRRQFPSQNPMPFNNDMINSNSHLQSSMHQQQYLGGSVPYTVQLPGAPNQQTPSNFLNYASMFHQQQGLVHNMSQQQHLHNPQLPTSSPMSTYLTMLPNPGGKAVHIMQSQNNIQNHMIIHGADSGPAPSTSGGVPPVEPLPGLNDKVSVLERQLQAIQAQNDLLMQINKKLLTKKSGKKHRSAEKREEESSSEEDSSGWSESSRESDASSPSSAKRKGVRTTRRAKRKVKKHDIKGLDDKGSFIRMRSNESKSPRRTQRSSKR